MNADEGWSPHHRAIYQRAVDRDTAGRLLEAYDLYAHLTKELEQTEVVRRQQDNPAMARYKQCRLRALQLKVSIVSKIKTAKISRCVIICAGELSRTYEMLLGNCLDEEVREVQLEEPLLQTHMQLAHLCEFMELVLSKCSNLTYFVLCTKPLQKHDAKELQQKVLKNLEEDLQVRNIGFQVCFEERCTLGRVLLSNGHILLSQLGLHYFDDQHMQYGALGSFRYEFRICKDNEVQYFIFDKNSGWPFNII